MRYQSPGGGELSAHTKNIGVGGAFIVTAQPAKVGSFVRLVVDVPADQPGGGMPIEVRAEVRWVVAEASPAHEAGMGVRFTGLDVDQLLALNEYFASLPATVDHD